MTGKLTIFDGLKTLKRLDSRILSLTRSAEELAAYRSIDKPKYSDQKAQMSKILQRTTDLIAYKAKLQLAIQTANIVTTVTMDGTTYTLASILAMKQTNKRSYDPMLGLLIAIKRKASAIEAQIDKFKQANPTSEISMIPCFDQEKLEKDLAKQTLLAERLDNLLENANFTTYIEVDPFGQEDDSDLSN